MLDAYANLLELEFGGDEAYLFSPNDCLDRPLESSAWTATHKRAFKKHFGEEISPKTLLELSIKAVISKVVRVILHRMIKIIAPLRFVSSTRL